MDRFRADFRILGVARERISCGSFGEGEEAIEDAEREYPTEQKSAR